MSNSSEEIKITWPPNLTQEQKNAIEEFKRRTIKDCTPKMLEDETVFYRFMKARDFNLENAEEMLRKHISWRKEHQIDTILTTYKPPEVLAKYVPNSIIGFDEEGSIVRYIDMGGSDPKGLLNSCTKEEFIRFHNHMFENDLELMNDYNGGENYIPQIVYLYNFDKMTFANATYKPGLEMSSTGIKILQDNYPERIKRIIIFNASIYFTFIFAIVKTVIAAPVLEKIRIFSSDGWKEALLQVIDADELPAFLGGSKTDRDGDPLCKSFIIHGQPVPKYYRMSESKNLLALTPGVKKLKVPPLSKQDIKFKVDDPGSILEWEFETKSKDICFGVYYKEKSHTDEKGFELISKQKIETGHETEKGMYKCEKAGYYFLVFDNSYSWIHPKEIYYKARIIEPNDIENPSK